MPSDETTSWKPIETVPHDSPVLVYTKPWGAIIATYASEHDEWLSRMQVPVSIKEEGDVPTHWQPLPEPPPDATTAEDTAAAADKPPAKGTPDAAGTAA